MGGEINWQALPILAELFGVEDVEAWLRGLVQVRDSMRSS